jgi:SAM-dependent methyltransferase
MFPHDEATQTRPAAETVVRSLLGEHKESWKVVFLNTCYEEFLSSHYSRNPGLINSVYDAQLSALNETFFGDSDFYSRGLNLSGLNAHDLVVNCAPLQAAWAKIHNIGDVGYDLVVRQIEQLRPDVVYVQDMAGTPAELLSYFKGLGIMIVGQIACAISPSIRFELYDLIFSSFPHFVDLFRQHGLTAYYQPLAFDPRILKALSNPSYERRDLDCSFVGGISSFHQAGGSLLETLARKTPIKIWGYGINNVPQTSAVARRHQGEAWGLDMFSLLNRSKITVNRHSEAASTYANNMRLFEATGCGALLITDYKDNLNDLFKIGKEVVAYRSPEECVALVVHFLRYPADAERIARAGQQRTLRDHVYENRMRKTGEILSRHLKYRKLQLVAPQVDKISTGFKDLTGNQGNHELTEGWKQSSVAKAQRGLVQSELASMYKGNTPPPFAVAARMLRNVIKPHERVLEIGCSSGYYYEVLEYLLKRPVYYTGVDYSESMIKMAREFYPRANFEVADGAQLPFSSGSFDVVISGGVLLHCPNYVKHIKETCRVTINTILLHRTPIADSGRTCLFEKSAYGARTVEIWFSEEEILGLFAQAGFHADSREQFAHCPTKKVAEVSFVLRRGEP